MAVRDKDFFAASHIIGNTAKDGSGTAHNIIVDSDGKLIISSASDITAIKNAVQIMDDWDSGDKCKVYLYGDDSGTPRLIQVNASGHLEVYTP
ncbi:MAG: hypothetical protein KAJ19_18840 [Gammaproteobacteria bacterium]|nr:hypothetical protein [Gammaproteobacteria bacterium]